MITFLADAGTGCFPNCHVAGTSATANSGNAALGFAIILLIVYLVFFRKKSGSK